MELDRRQLLGLLTLPLIDRAVVAEEPKSDKKDTDPVALKKMTTAALTGFAERNAAIVVRVKTVDELIPKEGVLRSEWDPIRKAAVDTIREYQDLAFAQFKVLVATPQKPQAFIAEINDFTAKLAAIEKSVDSWVKENEKVLLETQKTPARAPKAEAPKLEIPQPIVIASPMEAMLMQHPVYAKGVTLIADWAEKGLDLLNALPSGELSLVKDWRWKLETKAKTFPRTVVNEMFFDRLLKTTSSVAAIKALISEVDRSSKKSEQWPAKRKELEGVVTKAGEDIEKAFHQFLEPNPAKSIAALGVVAQTIHTEGRILKSQLPLLLRK